MRDIRYVPRAVLARAQFSRTLGIIESADHAKGIASAYMSRLWDISGVVNCYCCPLPLHLRPVVVQRVQTLGGVYD